MTLTSYTLNDLRNKYVHVGTPEYEVFMDACEGLGITWPSGNKPREEGIDDDFVPFDSLDGNLGNCDEDFYIYAQEYSQFIPKTDVVDVPEEAPWSIYNNTLPMSELTDEQAVELFIAWRNGDTIMCGHYTDKKFVDIEEVKFPCGNFVYRVKPKGELDEFVDKVLEVTNYKGKYGDNDVAYIARILYDNGCRFV